MTDQLQKLTPQPPTFVTPWSQIEAESPWIAPLANCAQDEAFHAEGDVWTHTRAVCDALTCLPEWRAMSDMGRAITFWAALLHDIGKPLCTQLNSDRRVTAPGHARRGARIARRMLWERSVPFSIREQIVSLVRFHAVPIWLLTRQDALRVIFEISQVVRCDWLELLARADMLGRRGPDVESRLDNIALFGVFARENACYDAPRRFACEATAYEYFSGRWTTPDYPVQKPYRTDAIVMSGLPGAGKDTWIKRHLAGRVIVSLDDIRAEEQIDPGASQGRVIARARERAIEALRRGTPIVWNATNVSKALRAQCIGFLASRGARVQLVHVETDEHSLRTRSRTRDRRVPLAVLERLIDRWEPPDPTEAHGVRYFVDDAQVRRSDSMS